ncbi:MAG TPA: hemerythrin domain-containing protein [Bdellovibrionota bacterium]|nr:hemerythrin domain-containing protein [Bdellovibrionota bacterium]
MEATSETGRIQTFLQQDHREIDEIFMALRREIRMVTDGRPFLVESLRSQFQMFDKRLERHIHWEEDLLFPAVEETRPDLKEGPGYVMRLEHEDIRRLKASANQRLSNPEPKVEALKSAASDLEEMFSILKDHNMKEEHVYYPMADELFSASKTGELMKRFRAS